MADLLKYKDYQGTAEVDIGRGVCRGKILFIADLVTYEAERPADLQREFEAAVEDYVETCKALGRAPQKAFTGQFNVRIDPDDHRELARIAAEEEIPLNSVVVASFKQYITMKAGATTIELVHRVQLEDGTSRAVTSSQPTPWETLGVRVH